MLLKGKLKLKLPEKKRHVPDRLGRASASGLRSAEGGVWDSEIGNEPPWEELETFQTIGGVEWLVDDEGTPYVESGARVHRKLGKEIFDSASAIIAEEKRAELEFELSHKVVNLEALRRIANCGYLDGSFRATTWKLLLGYLPAERDAWEGELSNNRLKYAKLKEDLILNPSELSRKGDESSKQERKNYVDGPLCRHGISNGDHPLSLSKASIWHQYFKDVETTEQIDRDLQRTHPDIKFFSGNSIFGKNNREAMRNILLLFAKLNPAIGYVQGMHEVLAPLYYIYSTDPDKQNASNAEADSFACFVRLLSDSVDHFCQQLDNSSVGIHSTLSHLSELLKANDEELWRHLEISSKVNPQFYAFRWITLLLTQEFEFHSILRIWDSLLSNPSGVQEMLLRVCCAMLVCIRSELLKGDFTSNLKLLQHYPQIELENLLHVAQELAPSSFLNFSLLKYTAL